MKTLLLVICVLLIAIVLLQSNKAEGASQIISGGNADLFSQRKERGAELFISRFLYNLFDYECNVIKRTIVLFFM